MKINPAFHRHPAEAKHIGHIVLSYTEIEVGVGKCLGLALGDQQVAYRTLFRLIGETARIDVADALLRPVYQNAGLIGSYGQMIGAVRFCVRVRNQFAHCIWGNDHTEPGLYFTVLNNPAKASETFDYWWRHVDEPLLRAQEEFFDYAFECLSHCETEYQFKTGKINSPVFPKPPAREQPILHNPPAEHIPPWLTGDEKQRHIERAQEAAGSDQPHPQRPVAPRPAKPSARQKREIRVRAAKTSKKRAD